MTTTIKDTLKTRLIDSLAPTHIEIIDDSDAHIGHAGAEGGAKHFHLIINSNAFENQSLVAKHRLIYAAVGDLIPDKIHALRIEIAN